MTISIQTIMEATDFSQASQAATAYAFELTRALEAELCLIHVVPQTDVDVMRALCHHLESQITPEALVETYYKHAENQFDMIVEQNNGRDALKERRIVTSQAADEIVSWATAKQAQIIILGTYGGSVLDHVLFGSGAGYTSGPNRCLGHTWNAPIESINHAK